MPSPLVAPPALPSLRPFEDAPEDPDLEHDWGDVARAAEDVVEEKPVFCYRTRRVFFCGNDIGCIKPFKEGTTKEALTTRCRRHGCSFIKRPHMMPSQPDVMKWLVQGFDLPAGKEGKSAHMRQWPGAPGDS